MIIKVVNPGRPPKRKRIHRKNKTKMKGANTMARTKSKHRRRVHRRHHRRNPAPAVASYSVNGGRRRRSRVHHRNPFASHRRHGRRHFRRNPESSGSMAPTANNALELLGGAFVGGFVVPLMGTTFGLVGTTKYLVQVALCYGLYVGGKALGMPKLGLAAAIAGAGVTAYQFSQDYGIMAGANQLLGNNEGDDEYWMSEFNRNLAAARGVHGIVPAGMHGIVPASQPVSISGGYQEYTMS